MASTRNQHYILFTFAVVFGWVLSLPYEGPVMYALSGINGLNGIQLNTITVFCLFVGLFTGRYISTNLKEGKRTIVLSTGGSLLLSLFIPFVSVDLWLYIVPAIGFLMGTVIAGFAHLIISYVPTTERSRFGADMLIYGNVVLVLAHALSTNAAPMVSFIVIELLLAVAFVLLLRIDLSKSPVPVVIDTTKRVSLKQFWIFFLFIFIISINSGIMFQVIYPYFSRFEVLTSIYTHLPYILAVYVLSRLVHINKLNFLYTGLGLWGLTFIIFSFIPATELGYILVTTFMLAAAGIFDYFWWSMMTGNFEHVKNPSSLFGLGLSLNVLGVWVGGVTGNQMMALGITHQQLSYVGLIVVMISMIIVLPLNHRLSEFLDTNEFMINYNDVVLHKKKTYTQEAKSLLSEREYEVFTHLIDGETDTVISEWLNISLNTIKTHNRKIYRKLNVSGRLELIKKCS